MTWKPAPVGIASARAQRIYSAALEAIGTERNAARMVESLVHTIMLAAWDCGEPERFVSVAIKLLQNSEANISLVKELTAAGVTAARMMGRGES